MITLDGWIGIIDTCRCTLSFGGKEMESVSNGGIVIVVVAARVHGRFWLLVDDTPYRGFKLSAIIMMRVAR